MKPRPTIVVLAAGPGGRPGSLEQALAQPLGPSTVLGCTLRQAIETGWPVVVVTSPALVALVKPWVATRDLVTLDEAAAARGIGYAIAAGVSAHADAEGWLVMPAELPRVQPATMRAVGQALADHPVAYAQYRGRRGHPVGFAAGLFADLIALDGNDGARRLVARYPASVVEVDDPGILPDAEPADGPQVTPSAAGAA